MIINAKRIITTCSLFKINIEAIVLKKMNIQFLFIDVFFTIIFGTFIIISQRPPIPLLIV